MIYATASQIKNGLGKYLDLALTNGEVQIVRYKRVIAKIVPVYHKDEQKKIDIKDKE